ncbi:hypothetical protein E2C01_031248 [Portunus trituberculatus]|uniref:Uncharacterized protein n=1 Tax=Portunus trituberculatus TaxID=210409 RepID=A0A5B7EXL6_PORTR|nr:hypothetical protein [Portunus trituberculatus]
MSLTLKGLVNTHLKEPSDAVWSRVCLNDTLEVHVLARLYVVQLQASPHTEVQAWGDLREREGEGGKFFVMKNISALESYLEEDQQIIFQTLMESPSSQNFKKAQASEKIVALLQE